MPKAMQYKANSIVYFKGDSNEKVYILNSGKVSLKSNDIETSQEIYDLIRTGEFFGVKSALGKYPREETAVVLQDSSMIVFSVPEFEQIAQKNTRIIMKMLKVFSNQLRRIHKQVTNLISSDEQTENPENGLFRIGEYYLKHKKYKNAIHVFRQYLIYYPSGKYAGEAAENIELSERRVQGSVQAGNTTGNTPVSAAASQPTATRELTDVAKSFYNAVSIFSQQKYEEALKEFKKIIDDGFEDEYEAKSQFEIGKCLFCLHKYEQCIKHFTMIIQKYPKHPDLIDALFYVGSCYDKNGDKVKAKSFYMKILSMASEDMPVHRKAKKAIKNLEDK